MANDKALRAQMVTFLGSGEAHVDMARAANGIPPKLRGVVPEGSEHSAWQLVETHANRAGRHPRVLRQRQIQREKMAGRLLAEDAGAAQRRRVAEIARRHPSTIERVSSGWRRIKRSISSPPSPHGTGQTYLREILLVVRPRRVSHRPARLAPAPARDMAVARTAGSGSRIVRTAAPRAAPDRRRLCDAGRSGGVVRRGAGAGLRRRAVGRRTAYEKTRQHRSSNRRSPIGPSSAPGRCAARCISWRPPTCDGC